MMQHNRSDIKIKQSKSEPNINEMLKLMENTVDDKLKSVKTYTPILLAVFTSVIAFLFNWNVGENDAVVAFLMLVLGLLLYGFGKLIISFFGKVYYKPIIQNRKDRFEPHRFDSYCYLSDEEFCARIIEYARKNLTENEKIHIKFLKQKVNECAYRRKCINDVLWIVEAGVALLIVMCVIKVWLSIKSNIPF